MSAAAVVTPCMLLLQPRELLKAGSSGTMVGLLSLGIALPPIVRLGSDEQKRRFCVPAIAGDKIAALAITEPGAGSDVAGVRTRAVRDDDHYVLNGAKTFITSGVRADYVTVLARTGDDPHGGLTFFVVEKGMPGYSVSRALKKTGWWASDTAELAFEDVRVPVSNRIGDEGSGFVALMQNFQGERLMLAFMASASAEIAYNEAPGVRARSRGIWAAGRKIPSHQTQTGAHGDPRPGGQGAELPGRQPRRCRRVHRDRDFDG